MLTNAERIKNYKKQNNSDRLTPAQQRRIKYKAHRERDELGEELIKADEADKTLTQQLNGQREAKL